MKSSGYKQNGFTLIELLVVIAIIAMLISIFGVGMRKIKISQRNLQQKAVFHSMDIGLELFSKDFNGYPDSGQINAGGKVVCGAQRLAEAMFGRDERGFHPRTKWHPALDMAATPPHPGAAIYTEITQRNRKEPYTELKYGGIHTIAELWGSPGTNIYDSAAAGSGTERAPVITDVFAYTTVTIGGETEKVGLPILYFKADSSKRFRVDASNVPVPSPAAAEYGNWIFNYDDNLPILQLNWLREITEPSPTPGLNKHYKDAAKSNIQVFYESLTSRHEDMNKDGTDDFFKAFNADTVILISAGYDGIYGTKDDITNFNY